MASIANKGAPVEGTEAAEASGDDDSSVSSDGSKESNETIDAQARLWRAHVKEQQAAEEEAKIDVRKPATLLRFLPNAHTTCARPTLTPTLSSRL